MDGRFPTSDGTPEVQFMGANRRTGQAPQTTGPAGWQFSVGPSMPEWPQGSPEMNFTSNAFGATNSHNGDMNNTWDFSDDVLWDAGIWEDWDLHLGNITVPNPELQASVLPRNNSSPNLFQQSEPPNNWNQQNYLSPTTNIYPQVDECIARSSNFGGMQPDSRQRRSSGISPGGRSGLLMRRSGQAANTIPETISLGWMQEAQDYKAKSDLKPESPEVSGSTASPKSPDQFATISMARSRQSEGQAPPPPQPKVRRYHKDTERQYRLRLNERFSALLKALPDDVVESASGHSGRSQADKALTKIEILALAKSHIASLEKVQTELEEESLVLRGQQELFKILCGARTGGS